MADDLDDFFNDVEEAEAQAVQEKEKEEGISENGGDEVVESKESGTKGNEEEPPAKRQKVAAAAPRPRGVVVAAASSSVSNKSASSEEAAQLVAAPIATQGPPPPMAPTNHLPSTRPGPLPPPPPPMPQTENKVAKPVKRVAAGKSWVDASLSEWPDNDFRIFVGNLGKDVSDAQLLEHFQKLYTSTAMAKVVKDAKTGVSKGFGFVSFLQPLDCAKAIREQDQKWLGSRPIRVKRSDWKDRNLSEAQKRKKKDAKKQKRFGGL